jgi:hypothetical protein
MSLLESILLHWTIAIFMVSTITLTISRGKIFTFLRLWLKDKYPALFELVNCAYCLCHWVALLVSTLFYGNLNVVSSGILNILFGAFMLIPPSCVIMGLMYKSIELIKPNIYERKDNDVQA